MFAASFFPVFLIRVLIRGVPRPDGRVYLGADQDAIDAPLRHRRDRYKTQASAPHRVVVAGPRRLRLQKERGGPPVQGDRPGERVRAPVARRPAAAAPRPAQGGARERRARGAAAFRRRRALFERGRVPVHRAAAALEPRPLGLPGARPERGQVRRGFPEPDARLRDALLPRPAFSFCRADEPAEPTVELTPRRRRDARTFRSVLCRGGRATEPIVEPTREPTAEPRTPSTPSPRRSNTAGTRRASCRSGGRSSARARSRRTRGSARSGRSGTRPSARAWPWSTTASRTSRASRVSRVLLVLVSSSFWCAEPAWRGPIRMTQQSRETLYRPTRRRRRRSRS